MITLFWTVAFCLGWNMVLGEGQIFHFIRKPFEGLDSEIINKKELYKFLPKKDKTFSLKIGMAWNKLKYFILKPLILCITCMASIWGAAIFIHLNGFSQELIIPMVVNCIAASFIQTFIWELYVRHIQ